MTTMKDIAAKYRKRWGWEPFKVGEVIHDAGVRILSEPIIFGPEMRNTHYTIEHTCCSKVSRLSHERIRERARKRNTLCRGCGHKRTAAIKRARKRGETPADSPPLPGYGVRSPSWPVPAYVARGSWLYCDAGAQTGTDWMACFSPSMARVLRDMPSETRRIHAETHYGDA